MISLLAVGAATVVACEIALRTPLLRTLNSLSGSARKAASLLKSKRISDHWKERMLPAYARRILSASLLLFACLVAIAAPVVLAAMLVTGSLEAGSLYLLRPLPLVLMILVGVAWIWGRRRLAG